MINLLTDQQVKDYQSLLAWKEFYLECSNEFAALKVNYKIERLESKHLEE